MLKKDFFYYDILSTDGYFIGVKTKYLCNHTFK